MKRFFIVAVILSASVCAVNAQIFVGGDVGFDINFGKYKNDGVSVDNPTYTTFSISPKVGYYLSDKLAIGMELGVNSSIAKTSQTEGDDYKLSRTLINVAPFVRCGLIEVDKLSLLLEGSVGLVFGKDKAKQGSVSADGSKYFGFGAFVLPVLSYDLTDKLALELSCDFLRFGFSSLSEKYEKEKETSNDFGFGLNSGDGTLNLGLIFKF